MRIYHRFKTRGSLIAGVLSSLVVRFYHWLRGNRLVAVVAALALVALPTVFAVFPGLTVRIDRGHRELIILGWVIVAAFATIASDARTHSAHTVALASHRIVVRQYLTLLLDPRQSDIPDHYNLCVYLSDVDSGLLLPWFPDSVTDPEDPRVFPFEHGCVGAAYSEGSPIVAVGDAVSSDEYGLTPTQQAFFVDSQVVVAAPISLDNGNIVGVLTAISDQNDGTFSSPDGEVEEDGVRLLEDLAEKVGDILTPEAVK